jgi:hypothetical protein
VLDLLSNAASCGDLQLPAQAEAAWLEETTGAGITAACPANTIDWKAVCDCLVPIPLWDCPACAKGVIEGQVRWQRRAAPASLGTLPLVFASCMACTLCSGQHTGQRTGQRPQPAPSSHASLQRMCPVVLLQLSADCRSGLAGSQLEVGDLGITYGLIW